jgi:hypothetical protein
VTHQGGGEEGTSTKVRDPLAAITAEVARPVSVEERGNEIDRPRRPSCALCGRSGRFVRHATLARTGRLGAQRPFRFRRESG